MSLNFKNSQTSYGFVSKNFHWIMAIIIVFNFILGLFLEDLEKGPIRFLLFNIHKSTGVLVIFLIILRFFWRLINTVPAHLSQNKFLNKISILAHYSFYIILLIVPLSGWTYSSAKGGIVSVFGIFTVPALVEKNENIAKIAFSIHQISVYTFITILALHILASIYHHYFLKDKTLKRMWFGNSN